MNVLDQFPRTRLRRGSCVRRLGSSSGIDGGFIVKAVEVTAGFLKVFDPFLRLQRDRNVNIRLAHPHSSVDISPL